MSRVERLDAPARKHEFARHEFVAGMAAAEQHFRLGAGAVDQHQRRGVARLAVGRRLVAFRLGHALGPDFGQILVRLASSCFPLLLPRRAVMLPASLVQWPSVLAAPAWPARPSGEKLEAQRAGDGRGLHQLDGDRGRRADRSRRERDADHGVRGLVVAEIFVADGARRHEAVGAGVVAASRTGRRGCTPEMRPSKVAPMRSARKCAISRSLVSRSASMARRSAGGNLRGDFGQRFGVGRFGQAVAARA